MKNQTIGVEIEMTGITREAAADVIAAYLSGIISYSHDCYDTYKITAPDGRVWKVMSDASIITKQKVCGQFINADKTYSVEFVTPILTYDADIETLQEIVRQLRQAGAVSDSTYKCGIHIHIGADKHTPNTLKNLVNLMAAKEDLIYKSLQIDPARVHYCQKVNEQLLETINRRKPQTLEALADIWYAGSHENRDMHYNSTRYHGLNLHSVFTKNTIEYSACLMGLYMPENCAATLFSASQSVTRLSYRKQRAATALSQTMKSTHFAAGCCVWV